MTVQHSQAARSLSQSEDSINVMHGSDLVESANRPSSDRQCDDLDAGHSMGNLNLFLIMVTLGGLAIGLTKASTPLFAVALGAPTWQIGLITGVQPMVFALISLPVGLAVNHFGARSLFIFGSVAAAIVYFTVAGTDSPYMLLLAATLASLFMPLRFVSTQSEFFYNLSITGGNKAGWLRAAQLCGTFVLGPMLGGYLVTWLGFEHTYWAIAFVFLLPAVLAPRVLSGRCTARKRRTGEASMATRPHVTAVFRNPVMIETSLIELVSHAALLFHTVFVVVLALEKFHVDRESATHLIALQGGAFMIALFMFDGFLATIGQARFYAFSFGSAIAGLLLLGEANTMLQLQLGGVLLGTGLGMLGIVNVVRLTVLGKTLGHATVAGASSVAGPLGGMLGTLGGGIASHWVSLQHIFLGIMTAMTIIASFTLSAQTTGRLSRLFTGLLNKALDFSIALLKASVYLVFPAFLLLLWHLSAHYGWTSTKILPPPHVVATTLNELIANGDVATHLKISLERVFLGFAIGTALGLLLGFAMGLSPTVEAYLGPMFKGLSSVPMLGWIPLLIVLLGIEEALKVAVIAIGCVVPVTLNTREGIRNVPREYLEVARVFRFSPWQLIRKVVFPAAIPPISAGVSLSLSYAWKAMVAIELIASSEGIGFLMVMGRQLFQLDVVLATILVIGSVGLLLDQLLRVTERRLTRWKPASV